MTKVQELIKETRGIINCNYDFYSINKLLDILELYEVALTELKHLNHHTIDEELWRIEAAFAKTEELLK